MIRRSLALAAATLVLSTGSALASYCENYTARHEHTLAMPAHLLAAVTRAETGYLEPENGTLQAWPWTISASGKVVRHSSKWAAIDAVRDLQLRGAPGIKVGCMQIDLQRHGHAFRNIGHALDPDANVAYGARLLASLHRRTGDWKSAVSEYHSTDPDSGRQFQRRVADLWDQLRADAAYAAWHDDSVAVPSGSDSFADRSYRWRNWNPDWPHGHWRVWRSWHYGPDGRRVFHRYHVWSDDGRRYVLRPYSHGGPWRPVGTTRFN